MPGVPTPPRSWRTLARVAAGAVALALGVTTALAASESRDLRHFVRHLESRWEVLGPLLGLLVVATLALRNDRVWEVARRALGAEPSTREDEGKIWPIGGFAALIAILVGLELGTPFYFTQDDNFAGELPGLVAMSRSLVDGVLPMFNPYTWLGTPALSLGVTTMTYPPAFLSYLFARFVLHRETATVDVYAIGHLVCGFWLAYGFLRDLGTRRSFASLGALAWPLAGWLLIAGRSWHGQLALAVFVPALAWSAHRLSTRPVGAGWAAWTGIAVSAAFHACAAQLWLYSCMCYAVLVATTFVLGGLPWRRLGWLVVALLVGAALCVPVVAVQALELGSIHRDGAWGGGIWPGVLSLFVPWPLALARHPNGWGSVDTDKMSELFDTGSVFATAGAALAFSAFGAAFARGVSAAGVRRVARANTALFAATFAFVAALGNDGPIWPIFSVTPVLSGMNSPCKFLPFVQFFLLVAGAIACDRVVRRAVVVRALAGVTVALLVWHAILARPSFYTYADSPPYPSLPSGIASRLADPRHLTGPSRWLTIGPDRSISQHYVWSLRNGWPVYYRALVTGGYSDHLVAIRPEVLAFQRKLLSSPVETARAFGVRWIWVDWMAVTPSLGPNAHMRNAESTTADERQEAEALEEVAHRVYTIPQGTLWELDGASPMAFRPEAPRDALPTSLDGAGAHVAWDGAPGGQVVVAVLSWPYWRAYADDRPTTFSTDDWGRPVVSVPPGTSRVDLRYEAPWARGLWIGLGLVVTAAAMSGGLAVRDRRFGAA